MPLLRKLIIAILGTMSLFTIIALFMDSKWEVKKDIIIKAPIERIFPLINETHNWAKWSPWTRDSDITLVYTFSGADKGKGGIIQWQGNQTPSGKRIITKSILNEKVEYQLFLEDGFSAQGEVILTQEEKGVRVTWRDYGDVGWNLLGRLVVSSVNEQIGLIFEKGLMRLKALAEE